MSLLDERQMESIILCPSLRAPLRAGATHVMYQCIIIIISEVRMRAEYVRLAVGQTRGSNLRREEL